jgi:hypothetical protein
MPEHSQPKPAGRGCLFYGCLSLVVLVIVVLLTGYLTIRYAVNTMIENYTDDAPQQFEAVEISDEERTDLMNRVAEFNAAKGKTNEPVLLTLTARDINALIAREAELRDRVRVSIEDDRLTARATLPLEPFSGIPFLSKLKGRHLNGSFQVGVGLQNGVADISVVSAEVNGTAVAQTILDEIQKDPSFQRMLNDPEVRTKLNQLDWIEIKEDRIEIATGGSEPPSN